MERNSSSCHVLRGRGWLMSATCVLWYVPRGNTGLSKHGTPRVSALLPPEPEFGPCWDLGGGVGETLAAWGPFFFLDGMKGFSSVCCFLLEETLGLPLTTNCQTDGQLPAAGGWWPIAGD